MEKKSLIQCLDAARKAGDAIMSVYNDAQYDSVWETKADKSPVTIADKIAHQIIIDALSKISHIPIISEEGVQVPYQTRKNWKQFWLVDPLDGTKEFIKKNGEFTVNIALIENGRPIFGVIYVPVQEILYYGTHAKEAFKQAHGNKPMRIFTRSKERDLKAVRSKSHPSQEEENVLKQHHVSTASHVGSSLKFCIIAEGEADIYYRHNPTMEWDTAAGQAILEAAGGSVFKGDTTKSVFSYNKQSLLNGHFLCLGRT